MGVQTPDGNAPQNNSYSIIINKFPKNIFEDEEFINVGKDRIERLFKEKLSISTNRIMYIMEIPSLRNKKNAKLDDAAAVKSLKNWVENETPALFVFGR